MADGDIQRIYACLSRNQEIISVMSMVVLDESAMDLHDAAIAARRKGGIGRALVILRQDRVDRSSRRAVAEFEDVVRGVAKVVRHHRNRHVDTFSHAVT